MWDSWVPDDPVSLEQMAEQKRKIEEEKDAQFEAANAEFCTQFREDMEKRQQEQRKKESNADRQKELGNRRFKRREYGKALEHYTEVGAGLMVDTEWGERRKAHGLTKWHRSRRVLGASSLVPT